MGNAAQRLEEVLPEGVDAVQLLQMNAGQRAMVAARYVENMSSGNLNERCIAAGKLVGLGRSMVYRALTILRNGTPAEIASVDSGEKHVWAVLLDLKDRQSGVAEMVPPDEMSVRAQRLEKQRVERLDRFLGSLVQTCQIATQIELPQLTPTQANAVKTELNAASRGLQALKNRVDVMRGEQGRRRRK